MVIEQAVAEQGIPPGTLTLGTDNGSAFTARTTRLVMSGLRIAHRRGGYRDPESQTFIESWFHYLKEHCVWRNEFETLDQAREVIAAYISRSLRDGRARRCSASRAVGRGARLHSSPIELRSSTLAGLFKKARRASSPPRLHRPSSRISRAPSS